MKQPGIFGGAVSVGQSRWANRLAKHPFAVECLARSCNPGSDAVVPVQAVFYGPMKQSSWRRICVEFMTVWSLNEPEKSGLFTAPL